MKHKLRDLCTALGFLIVLSLSTIASTTDAQIRSTSPISRSPYLTFDPTIDAQTRSYSQLSPMSGSTVSVRALQIPGKALNAYREGIKHLQKGDLKRSLLYFDKALQSFPGFYEAYNAQGVVEMNLNRDDQALQSFRRAIDLSGGRYARANFGYGLMLFRQGKSEEAEAVVRRGVEQDPAMGAGHLLLSMVLFKLSRLDAAEKSAHEALSRSGQDLSDAYLVLADIHAQRRDYRAYVEDLETYLRLEPRAPNKQFLFATLGVAKRLAASSAAEKLPE
jgi:tetratricopeptide (TPR) repeat protein